MIEYEYLTPEDYKTAEAIGLKYNHVYQRFYIYGWDKQKAITTPLKKPKLWSTWKELALKHGIQQNTFYQRVQKGMSYEEAATKPVIPHSERKYQPTTRVPKAAIDKAAANGINERALKHRVYVYRWDLERATTEPLHTSKRKKVKK